MWDAASASLLKKIVAQGVGEVGAVGFTTDGFVSTGDDGVIPVWDKTTFKARELTVPGSPSGFGRGTSGSISAHCASVRSVEDTLSIS